RETFGFEKSFLGHAASFGMLLPLHTLNADPGALGGGFSSTNVGDLTLFGKYVLCDSPKTGNVLSCGLVLTVPTGPAAFAGTPDVVGSFHNTTLAPWLGFVLGWEGFFVQGFSSIDVPSDTRDVTLF